MPLGPQRAILCLSRLLFLLGPLLSLCMAAPWGLAWRISSGIHTRLFVSTGPGAPTCPHGSSPGRLCSPQGEGRVGDIKACRLKGTPQGSAGREGRPHPREQPRGHRAPEEVLPVASVLPSEVGLVSPGARSPARGLGLLPRPPAALTPARRDLFQQPLLLSRWGRGPWRGRGAQGHPAGGRCGLPPPPPQIFLVPIVPPPASSHCTLC